MLFVLFSFLLSFLLRPINFELDTLLYNYNSLIVQSSRAWVAVAKEGRSLHGTEHSVLMRREHFLKRIMCE